MVNDVMFGCIKYVNNCVDFFGLVWSYLGMWIKIVGKGIMGFC